MVFLISFDIDGTLETGNGPGPITLEMVRRALALGHVIGSCSDRPVQDQQAMWAAAGIEPSFTVLKHKLDTVKTQFTEVEIYYHIGDTELDQHYARLNAFEFEQVQVMEPHAWMLNDAGEAGWGPNGRGMVRAPSATTLGLSVPQPEAWG